MLNTTSADSRDFHFAGLLSGCWTDADHADNGTGNNGAECCSKNRPQFRWRATRYQNHWTRNFTNPNDKKRPMPVTGVTTIQLTGSSIATAEAWGTATVTGGSSAFPTATVIIIG